MMLKRKVSEVLLTGGRTAEVAHHGVESLYEGLALMGFERREIRRVRLISVDKEVSPWRKPQVTLLDEEVLDWVQHQQAFDLPA